MFDLRRRGKVGKVSLVGTNGNKFEAIKEHLDTNIGKVYNMDTSLDHTSPAKGKADPDACMFFQKKNQREGAAHVYLYLRRIDKQAINDYLTRGDAITIFTPDPTHFDIALYAIQRGIHVLVTKPAVKLLEQHQILIQEAEKHNVVVMVEHHKRFDPVYCDARAKAISLGHFNYFYSYMSQPKRQLDTFRAWAGKESDIR